MVRPQDGGSFRLVRLAGIDVFIHWTWFAVAVFQIQSRPDFYSSPLWKVAEYLALFGIVLMHEFGHALACRQVGGEARQIILWPLGGIAFVNPPPRPGAVLWSIAAGPLVNVLLLPVTIGLVALSASMQWPALNPDLAKFLEMIALINGALLIFNLLPIYPLDGGQIVQALLWFWVGRARSLMIVSVIGLATGLAVVGYALANIREELWLGIIAAFVAWRSWVGFQQGRLLAKLLSLPRHQGIACPSCGLPPLAGDFWVCGQCQSRFDPFVHYATCSRCAARFADMACLDCGRRHNLAEWFPRRLPPREWPAEAAGPRTEKI
jgi:Zn-dependent protease